MAHFLSKQDLKTIAISRYQATERQERLVENIFLARISRKNVKKHVTLGLPIKYSFGSLSFRTVGKRLCKFDDVY